MDLPEAFIQWALQAVTMEGISSSDSTPPPHKGHTITMQATKCTGYKMSIAYRFSETQFL